MCASGWPGKTSSDPELAAAHPVTGDLADTQRPTGGSSAPSRLARNALSSGARYAVPALLALLVTPFALRILGESRFGLWALAGVVLTLSRVLDFGLQRSLVRAVAVAEGADGTEHAVEAISTGRGAALLLGFLYVAVIWLARDTLVSSVLRLPSELQAEGRYVLVGTAAVAALEAVFMPYQAALDGIGRMDLSSVVDAVQRSISALLVVVVLSAGWGLPGLVWKNLACALFAGVAYRSLLSRRAPELAHAPISLVPQELRRLLSFGRHVQVVNVSALVVEMSAKLVLSRSAGVDAVALYELASRVVNQLGGALMAASTAVFPAAAEAAGAAREGTDDLQRLYCGATRYLGWLTLPAYGLLVALAPAFVRAWLGAGYTDVAQAIVVLSLGYAVGVLAAPAHMVAQGSGRARISSTAAIATVIVASVLFLVAARAGGLYGVVAAVSAGVATGGATAWLLFARSYGSGWRTIGCIGVRGPVAALLGAAAAFAVGGNLPPTLVSVAAAGIAGLAAYGVALAATGALGPRERAMIASLLGPRRAAR